MNVINYYDFYRIDADVVVYHANISCIDVVFLSHYQKIQTKVNDFPLQTANEHSKTCFFHQLNTKILRYLKLFANTLLIKC